MKAQDAEFIFLQLIKELNQYQSKTEETTFFTINEEENLLSFSINDRFAINRLLAAGFKETLAIEVSSVLHEISLQTNGNQMNCIVKKHYTLPIETIEGSVKNIKTTTTEIIHSAEKCVVDLLKRLSSNQYYLVKIQ